MLPPVRTTRSASRDSGDHSPPAPSRTSPATAVRSDGPTGPTATGAEDTITVGDVILDDVAVVDTDRRGTSTTRTMASPPPVASRSRPSPPTAHATDQTGPA